jgi:hypothetical protein
MTGLPIWAVVYRIIELNKYDELLAQTVQGDAVFVRATNSVRRAHRRRFDDVRMRVNKATPTVTSYLNHIGYAPAVWSNALGNKQLDALQNIFIDEDVTVLVRDIVQ